MGKIKCYLLILNLVISIFAFSGMIGLVGAQGGGEGGLHTYPGSPIIHKDKPACIEALTKANEKAKKTDETTVPLDSELCKSFNMEKYLDENKGPLPKELKESFEKKENWDAATSKQRNKYFNKKMEEGPGKYYGDPERAGFSFEGDDIVLRGKKVPIEKFNSYLKSELKKANKARKKADKPQLESIDIQFEAKNIVIGKYKKIGRGGRVIPGQRVSLDDIDADFKKYESFKNGFFGKIFGKNMGTLLIVGGIGVALFMAFSGDGKSKSEKSGKGGVKSEISEGAAVAVQTKDGETKAFASSKEDGTVGTVETTSETSITTNNVNVEVPNQVAAEIPSADTQIVLDGTRGDDPSNPPATDTTPNAQLAGNTVTPQSNSQTTTTDTTTTAATAVSLPLIKSITGKAVSDTGGQSLILIEHIIEINGHDISTFALKTFSSLIVGGRNLGFSSGNLKLLFNNQRIYVSRVFSKVPHGVNEISNKLDLNNKFQLIAYTNRKGQLTDKNQIISFGDIVREYSPTENPEEIILVSNLREEMLT